MGDETSVGAPKAGVFADGAARTAAHCIISEFQGKEFGNSFDGKGSCYLEFGEKLTGRVDADFFSGSSPKGNHFEASRELFVKKHWRKT